MSDQDKNQDKTQDSIHVTERLEIVKTKNAIIEHAGRHTTTIDEATADIIVRGAIVALARQVPPVLILKGTAKLLQAFKELVVERITTTLNAPDPEEESPFNPSDIGA